MLWYRLVFVLVAMVDCILLMKRQSECRILRGLPGSRINCRLQTFAASWIHLTARRRIGADMGRFNPGTHQSKQSKTLQAVSEQVLILVEDTLNTSCEAVSNLFN